MRYYISNLHFFHENMNTKMDKRGFESVEAMNEYMIYKGMVFFKVISNVYSKWIFRLLHVLIHRKLPFLQSSFDRTDTESRA